MKYVAQLHIFWHKEAQIKGCKAFSKTSCIVYSKPGHPQSSYLLGYKTITLTPATISGAINFCLCLTMDDYGLQLNTLFCVTCHNATTKSEEQKLTKSVDPSSTTPLVVGTHTMVCNNNKVLKNPL